MNGQCKGKEVCTSGVPSRAGLTLVALLLGVGLAVFLIVAGEDSQAQALDVSRAEAAASQLYLVRDMNLSTESSLPMNLINVSGILFFAADDGSHGVELWKSNGTPSGTVLVKDMFTGGLR